MLVQDDGDALALEHRSSSERPPGTPSMRMNWHDLLFMHWPVPVQSMRALIPASLEIDTYDGMAWVGLVPFTMTGVRHLYTPAIPGLCAFHECNVRTYVSMNGEPGVWFFSLDAVSRLAVWGAQTFWNLNYVSSDIEMSKQGSRIDYAVRRRRTPDVVMRCAWTINEAEVIVPEQHSLEWFLTERYMLYAVDRRGRARRSRIWHERWPLRRATLHDLEDGLVRAAGVDVGDREPIVLASPGVRTAAWKLERVV